MLFLPSPKLFSPPLCTTICRENSIPSILCHTLPPKTPVAPKSIIYPSKKFNPHDAALGKVPVCTPGSSALPSAAPKSGWLPPKTGGGGFWDAVPHPSPV